MITSLEARLTATLLKHGERETVAAFLERSAPFKGIHAQQAIDDAAAIRAGMAPSFYGAYYPSTPR